MIPRITTVPVELPFNEELNITPIFDLHAESSACDYEGFSKVMRQRAKLPNHHAILGGDVMDLVVPVDLKRWRASVQDKSLVGRDDWLNAGLDLTVDRLTEHDIKYDLVTVGNHEDEFKKRHGVDVTSMLARELRCARGGYSGVIQYQIITKQLNGNTQRRVPLVRILYHHGAWGGRVQKGFGGARDFERAFSGHQVFCYGHNHHTTIHRESRFRPARGGKKMIEYPIYFVCCGAWVETYSDDARTTHYGERAGYMPTSRVTPLIRVKASNAAGGWNLDYVVEV